MHFSGGAFEPFSSLYGLLFCVRPLCSSANKVSQPRSKSRSVLFRMVSPQCLCLFITSWHFLCFWKNLISQSAQAHLHLLSTIMHAPSLLCFKMQMHLASRWDDALWFRSHILTLNAHAHWAENGWRSWLNRGLIYSSHFFCDGRPLANLLAHLLQVAISMCVFINFT